MTVRGFLAWYLSTVTLVSALGASAWLGIQSRGHMDTVAVVPPPALETSPPSPHLADVKQMQLTASDQAEVTHLPQSNGAPLPLTPLNVPIQSESSMRTASSPIRPWIASIRQRPARKDAARASIHRYSRTVVAQRADPNPYYGPRSYVIAYPPVPWQVSRYVYSYPPNGYYQRYGYYYYPAH